MDEKWTAELLLQDTVIEFDSHQHMFDKDQQLDGVGCWLRSPIAECWMYPAMCCCLGARVVFSFTIEGIVLLSGKKLLWCNDSASAL